MVCFLFFVAITIFLLVLTILSFNDLNPLFLEISHHFTVFMLLKPWLKFNDPFSCKVKVWRIVRFHENVYFLDNFKDFSIFTMKLLAGIYKIYKHGVKIDLKIFESFQFVLIRLKYIPKCSVDELIFGYTFYRLRVFSFVTDCGKILLTIS